MRSLRALWHPFTPLVLVLVVLPLVTLATPADQRTGWLTLNFLVGSPLAAWAAVRALRSALARVPVPADAADPSYRETWLQRTLRWFLILVSVLGTASVALAALGTKAWRPPPGVGPDPIGWELAPFQSLFLAVLPLLFSVFGLRLWRDLVATRRRRAQGLPPLPLEPPSSTGSEELDRRLARLATDGGTRRSSSGKATLRLSVTVAIASALSNLLPPSLKLTDALSKGAEGEALREFWRFFTASFVHQEVVALAVGLLAFLAVAPIIEALLGGVWLTVGFVGGGFLATLASQVFLPGRNYMGMTGADAAVAGMLLFFGLLQRHRLPLAVQRRIAVRCLTVLVIVAFAGALLPAADTAAHVGGFMFGVLLSPLARPREEVRSAMEEARAETPAAAPASEAPRE
jgi:membrane associated rhomboid family serine protease